MRSVAYVCLVMGGDSYVPGALVTAWSLERADISETERRADRVCMVTPDVSAEACNALSAVFDRVIPVPVWQVPVVPMATAKQEGYYGTWMSKGFTKWQCLRLVEYQKVLFIDVDVVILRCMDELFDLAAPAGTFSSPWVRPYAKGPNGISTPYGVPHHGETIRLPTVQRALEGRSVVAIGTTVLLEPSLESYETLKKMLEGNGQPFGVATCFSGKDEQALARLSIEEKKDWTHIGQEFNFIPWHPRWLHRVSREPFLFHYFHEKPWAVSGDAEVWPDFQVWWQSVASLVRIRPDLARWFPPMPTGMLDAPCFWCTERGGGGVDDATAHCVLDSEGRLVCPRLKM